MPDPQRDQPRDHLHAPVDFVHQGTTSIVSQSWSVEYTYDVTRTITGTDSAGNTATATAGAGSQPALFLRLFNCGF